ncbi:unnamed protein product [Allacma fusca]|uniref:Uncharacterized protein n=1 Tax=Allacma fusca TaxID=39272 RepID=A0A8J2LTF9_9HEXA|nr:unnamed protein product [Allacma fusca]
MLSAIFLVVGLLASQSVGFSYLPEGSPEIQAGNIKLTSSSQPGGGVIFSIDANGTVGLQGQLGLALPHAVDGAATQCQDPGQSDVCLEWGDYAKLSVVAATQDNGNCARIEWVSTFARRLEDCFDLVSGQHWYGGIQVYYQTYPYERQEKTEMANVPGVGFGGVNENYWFTTLGFSIHVDEDVPLFSSLNTVHKDQFCLVAKDVFPFVPREEVRLNYELCGLLPGENLLDLHRRTLLKYYKKPEEVPDQTMLLRPFWSTWAQYHTDVDEKIVLDYSQKIKDEGFLANSHIEIDDNWETCYGEQEFNLQKFPDPAGMVRKLKDLGFGVTLWIHPFINFNCPSFKTAFEKNYFVRDTKDKPATTSWWAGGLAGVMDFTNGEGIKWWTGRLDKLREDYGIDSFKFDAGEYDSLPASVKMDGDQNLIPNTHTVKYVESVTKYGGMIEVRVGRGTQHKGVFVRMLDKDSRWGYDNGLKSLIPTLLHFSMLGYSFCLPDMIGGNAYGGRPSKELYIRWMQANVLMPAVQVSIVPWEYDSETVNLTKDVLAIRDKYSAALIVAARQSVVDGTPINRPMWFTDPEDPRLFAIDDQYMLGNDIIVAPVVSEGATARDIYLPRGRWNGSNSVVYSGPVLLQNFAAPLNVVPIFVRA